MASTRPRKNKDGAVISYEIRVSRGRDVDGKQIKPFTMTWTPPEGWSKRSIEKELQRVAGQFEADCKAGKILTKEEKAAKERQRRADEAKKVSFSQYIKIFMNDKGLQHSENTRVNYLQALDRAASRMGTMFMCDIDMLTIKQYLNNMQMIDKNPRTGKLFAHATVVKHYIVLHAFFENARENKVIPSNPMQDMKRPKPRKDEIIEESKALSVNEVNRLLECIAHEPLKWRALIMFMLDSGCRRGEAVGLKWSDIDFDTGAVVICRNAQYTAGKGVYTTTPKSGKARTIYVNPPVLAVLKEWRTEQAKLLLAQGLSSSGFCFTHENGKLMNPQAPTAYLYRFGEKHGFPDIHPHMLRHTMASISIANGADMVSVSKKLGHAQVSITLDVYSHESEEAKRKASSILNDLIYKEA